MESPKYKELLNAGVHYGHMRKKWNPQMRPYIFMEKKGIHIIDLNRTIENLNRASARMRKLARSGKKIMFVATKKQSRSIVAKNARSVGMPYVTDRWLGGMMTNFSTVRRSVKKMKKIDRMLSDGTLSNITKKERLTLSREQNKIEKTLGGIANLNRLPHALFIVDISHEHIAVAEANKLGIETFAMVDTNSDPNEVDYAIPSNDDAAKSIKMIVDHCTKAIKLGLEDRKKDKEQSKKQSQTA